MDSHATVVKIVEDEVVDVKYIESKDKEDEWLEVVGIKHIGYGEHYKFKIESIVDGKVTLISLAKPCTRASFLKTKELEGFLFNGYMYQYDEKSRLNITGKALRLQLDNTDSITHWRTMDNQMVSFTKAEFIEFAKAVSDYYEQCFMDSLAMTQ